MRIFLLQLFLFCTITISAQDLSYKIPNNATAVVNFNGTKFQESITIDEVNRSKAVKKLLDRYFNDKEIKDLKELGLNYSANFYYYHHRTDSINYNCFWIPIENAEKFQNFLSQDSLVISIGNVKKFQSKDRLMLWDDKKLFFVEGTLNESFLSDSVNAERYDIKEVKYFDYYYPRDSIVIKKRPERNRDNEDYYYDNGLDVEGRADAPTPAIDDDYYYNDELDVEADTSTPAEEVPLYSDDDEVYLGDLEIGIEEAAPYEEDDYYEYDNEEHSNNSDELETDIEEEAVPYEEEDDYEHDRCTEETIEAPAEDYDYDYGGYYGEGEYREYHDEDRYKKDLEEQEGKKAKLLNEWLTNYTFAMFFKERGANSIMNKLEYVNARKSDALLNYYIDFELLVESDYNGYSNLSYFLKMYSGLGHPKLYGLKTMWGDITSDKNQIKLSAKAEMYPESIKFYKEVYDAKLNPKFIKYINTDKVLGLMSGAINTQKYLELFPNFYVDMFSRVSKDHEYIEEMKLFAEFFSLFLDEKAVGQAIKGDALLVFNRVTEKETEYITYDYDSEGDYSMKEKVEIKKEILPDVTFMFTSEDPKIINSVLNYGIKKKHIELKDGIYSFTESEFKPYTCYVLIKDGIVFFTTSYEDIIQIKNDTYISKINKKHKKDLLNSLGYGVFYPKNISPQLPKEGFVNDEKYMKTYNLFNEMGIMYGKTLKIEGNKLSGEFVMEKGEHDLNAIKYLFSLGEQLNDL